MPQTIVTKSIYVNEKYSAIITAELFLLEDKLKHEYPDLILDQDIDWNKTAEV